MAVGVVASLPDDQGVPSEPVLTAAVWVDQEPGGGQERPPMVIHRNVQPSDLPGLAGAEATEVRCAIPLGMASQTKRRLLAALDGLAEIGLGAVVDAPIAAFAASPPGPSARAVPGPGPQLHAIALGQHDGSVSLLIADRVTAQLVAVGLVDDDAGARALMRRALLASGWPADGDPNRPDDSLEDRYSSVTAYELSGSGAELVSKAFGRVPVEQRTPRIADACLLGLSRLHRLAAWTATWPTARLHVGDGWTRQASPLRSQREIHLVRRRPDTAVWFSDPAGQVLPLQAGSVQAMGCAIPARLGPRPKLELCDDGRLLMHGPPGVAPLAARIRWPIAGSGAYAVGITGANGAGVELLDPSVRRPEQVEDVQPELGRQPQ